MSAVVLTTLALFLPSLAAATPNATDELEAKLAGRIGIRLDNVKAPDAIRRICEAAGVSFAIDPELFGDMPPVVTLSLEETRVETALAAIAAQLRVQVYRTDKMLYFSRLPMPANRFKLLIADPRAAADRRLLQLLDRRTTEVRAGFEPGTPLEAALEFISKRHNLDILIDHVAFDRAGVKDIGAQPISLPPLRDVPLGLVLDELVARLDPPGTYLVRSGHVLVTTQEKIQGGEHISQPVTVAADEQPFEDICRDLSEKTGVTIVVDRRLGEKAKTPITATIRRSDLLTAVELLADQIDARVVMRSYTLYVTTATNAKRLQEEGDPRCPRDK